MHSNVSDVNDFWHIHLTRITFLCAENVFLFATHRHFPSAVNNFPKREIERKREREKKTVLTWNLIASSDDH